MFSEIRKSLAPEPDDCSVWENGHEFVDAIHRPSDLYDLSHFKLIFIEI
jgi:hypothetical protein